MKKQNTSPFSSLKIDKKDSDKQLLKKLQAENKTEGVWKVIQERRFNPVPNMSGYRSESLGTKLIKVDNFKRKKMSKKLLDFIFQLVDTRKNFALYVHDGPFGFAPIFAVVYKKTDKKVEYIFKFEEQHVSKKDFVRVQEVLYSKKNQKKHQDFKIPKINPIDHYYY